MITTAALRTLYEQVILALNFDFGIGSPCTRVSASDAMTSQRFDGIDWQPGRARLPAQFNWLWDRDGDGVRPDRARLKYWLGRAASVGHRRAKSVLKTENQARAVAATPSGDRRATPDGAAGQSERYREWSRW
jgi:hypothetical protein